MHSGEGQQPASESDDSSVRLSKRVAAIRGCSRAEAERHIEAGHVTVDGLQVDTPQTRVRPDQTVEVAAQARLGARTEVSFLLHANAGIGPLPADGAPLAVAQAVEWLDEARRSSRDDLRLPFSREHLHRLMAVGQLPVGASGLMVLTQNPALARALRDRAADMEEEWLLDVDLPAEVDAAWRESVLGQLNASLKGLRGHKLGWQSDRRLRLAGKALPAAWLDRMRDTVQIVAARRQRLGRIALSGLEPGQWRYLASVERF